MCLVCVCVVCALRRGKELMPRREDGSICYSDAHYRDTWAAMEGLVDKGLVRAIGLSNFNARQTADIISIAKHKPVVNQVWWNTFLWSFAQQYFSYFGREKHSQHLVTVQVECHPYLCQADLLSYCRSVTTPFHVLLERKSSSRGLNVLSSDSWPQVSGCLCDGLQSSRKRGPTLGFSRWAEPPTGPSTGDHRSKIREESSSGHPQVGQKVNRVEHVYRYLGFLLAYYKKKGKKKKWRDSDSGFHSNFSFLSDNSSIFTK